MPALKKTEKENSDAISIETKVSAETAVRKATRFDISLIAIQTFLISIVGGLGIPLELNLLHFPVSNLFVFLFLWLIFPILITTIALYRNRILEKIFNRVSSYTYLVFAKFWKIYFYIVFITTIIIFFLGFVLPNNLSIKLLPLPIFGLGLPFYYIFRVNAPLTSKGEIKILFENLHSNLYDFSERNIFWEQIAGKIEHLLASGNIEVSKDDLMYYFNAKLWETKDNISIYLRDIEAWLLNEQNSSFDSITQIVPKDCFKVGKRKNLLRNIVNEPTAAQVDIIKYLSLVIIVIVVAVLGVVHPEFVNQIHLF